MKTFKFQIVLFLTQSQKHSLCFFRSSLSHFKRTAPRSQKIICIKMDDFRGENHSSHINIYTHLEAENTGTGGENEKRLERGEVGMLKI